MKIFKQDKEVPRHAVWYHSPFWYWDLIRTGFAFELGGIADRSATNRQKTHAAAQKVTFIYPSSRSHLQTFVFLLLLLFSFVFNLYQNIVFVNLFIIFFSILISLSPQTLCIYFLLFFCFFSFFLNFFWFSLLFIFFLFFFFFLVIAFSSILLTYIIIRTDAKMIDRHAIPFQKKNTFGTDAQ